MPDDRPLDNVTVTERRRTPPGPSRFVGSFPTAPPPRRTAGTRTAVSTASGSQTEEEEEELEVVTVTAVAPVVVRDIAGLTRLEYLLGRERAALLQRAVDAANRAELEEIKVTAKRAAPAAARSLLRGPLAFLSIFDIGARIVDTLSQRRLDEYGELATRTVEPGPDTPVQTIPEDAPLDVVTTVAKRLPQGPTAIPIYPTNLREIPRISLPIALGLPTQLPTAVPEILIPQPETPTTKAPKPLTIFAPITDPFAPGQRFLTNPLGSPRSVQLRIPRRTTPPETPPGNLTPFEPTVLASPLRASSNCPPCKKKKEKDRTKCYKTLVKQAKNPKSDKVYKLVEIHCDTGREIYKRKGQKNASNPKRSVNRS